MRSRITRACALKTAAPRDLLPEPVSGDADGRFDRLEEVEVGISRSQLVGDGLDEVARPRTRLCQVAEDDGLDGAEAVVGLDQRPVREKCAAGLVVLKYLETALQVADMFTKQIFPKHFERLRRVMIHDG